MCRLIVFYDFLHKQRELREEDRRYRDYLAQLMAEEKAREAALEKLIQQEVEAAWEKRIDQWRRERKARKLLLEDVMAGRAKQLQERCKLCSLICHFIYKILQIMAPWPFSF